MTRKTPRGHEVAAGGSSAEQTDELNKLNKLLTGYTGVSAADQVREAMQRVLQSRPNDPEFRATIEAIMERTRDRLMPHGEVEMARAFDPAAPTDEEQHEDEDTPM